MDISQLVTSIDAAIASLGQSPPSDADRQQLLAASKRLQEASESALDAIASIVLGIHRQAAIRTAVDMGLFPALLGAGEGGITALELAEKTKSDEILVTRIMRVVTATSYAKELGIRHYTTTPKTGLFAPGSPLIDVIVHMAPHAQALVKLPEYFRVNGYANPNSMTSGPFQFAFNFKGTYFDWLKSIPEEQEAFNRMMALTRMGRGEEWFDFFPTESRFSSTDPSSPLLVDIGGGLGHDLSAFHKRFPNLPGKLILQDLEPVISNITYLDPKIERQIYNFFTPQPVKGARAYYMRQILHDHPDGPAIQILKGIREAMTKDSVLLVNENFLPETGASLYNAEIDLSMMALFASMERTEKQWVALLEEAGMNVVKVWTPKAQLDGSGTVFEAVRKD